MEAIRSLHQQLDDDENGNIDLSESDDVSKKKLFHSLFFRKAYLNIKRHVLCKFPQTFGDAHQKYIKKIHFDKIHFMT